MATIGGTWVHLPTTLNTHRGRICVKKSRHHHFGAPERHGYLVSWHRANQATSSGSVAPLWATIPHQRPLGSRRAEDGLGQANARNRPAASSHDTGRSTLLHLVCLPRTQLSVAIHRDRLRRCGGCKAIRGRRYAYPSFFQILPIPVLIVTRAPVCFGILVSDRSHMRQCAWSAVWWNQHHLLNERHRVPQSSRRYVDGAGATCETSVPE